MKRTNFLSWLMVFGATAAVAQAQVFLGGVDHDYSGTSYNSSAAEVSGWFYADGNLHIQGDFTGSFDSPGNLHVSTIHVMTTMDGGNQSDLPIDGTLHWWAGFSPDIPVVNGVAQSWLHSGVGQYDNGLDLGDLTDLSIDRPALRMSVESNGSYTYPTIYFSGYDSNTSWVWQQNGLDALGNASLLAPQMKLDSDGMLTLTNATSNTTIQIAPDDGSLTSGNTTTHLLVTATATTSNISLVTGNATVVFHDHGGNATLNLTSSMVTSLYASGNASFGVGQNVDVSAWKSLAFGNNLNTTYFASMVMGYSNAVPGNLTSANLTTWQAGDPLFVVGNGSAPDPLVVYKNGATVLTSASTVLNANLTYNGTLTINGDVQLSPNATAGSIKSVLSTQKGEIPLISP